MHRLAIDIDGRRYEVSLDALAPNRTEIEATVDGEVVTVILPAMNRTLMEIEWVIVDGRPYEISFDRDLRWLNSSRGTHRLAIRDLAAIATPPASRDGRVKAPIPGHIRRVLVHRGEEVQAGQALLILEAMKMENEIRAPRSGVVMAMHVRDGQQVALDEVLLEIGE